jgi:hypothetical protein
MAYPQELRQLKDYDVLGVGASRRKCLEADLGAKILLTHSFLIPKTQRPVYEAILDETLQWLKPLEVREETFSEGSNKSPEEYLLQVLLEDFQREFPKTSSYLKQDLFEVVKNYLLEFPWQGPLLSDHFRYFPVFLKRKFQDSRLYLIVQKEWLWSYLSFAEFGTPVQEQGRILVNPSLQSLYSLTEVEEVRLQPGLFFVYYDDSRQKVRDYKVDAWEAAVVDLLQEDRKYTLDQLIEQVLMTELEAPLSRAECRKKLFNLKSEGILLESGSNTVKECL